MNCDKARQLIDQRLQSVADGSADQTDWSELDAHLAGCPACSADWLELLQTRKLLAGVATDAPTSEEVETMWTAIESSLAVPAPTAPAMRWYHWRFVASGIGLAACLVIAFHLGDMRYGWAGWQGLKKSSRSAGALVMGDAVQRGRRGSAQARADLAGGASLGYVCPSTSEELPGQAAGDAIEGVEPSCGYRTKFDGYYIRGVDAEQAGIAESEALVRGDDFFGRSAGQGRLYAGLQVKRYSYGTDQNTETVRRGVPASRKRVTDQPQAQASELRDGEIMLGTEFKPHDYADADGLEDTRGYSAGRTLDSENQQELKQKSEPFVAFRRRVRMTDEPPRAFDTPGPDRGVDAVNVEDRIEQPYEARYVSAEELAEGQTDFLAQERQVADKPSAPAASSTPPVARVRPKIIKTGRLDVEVEAYEPAVEQVHAIADALGGFVADAATEELAGGALKGKIVIRVAPEQFDALFAALKGIGRTEAENVKAADVTAEYVDLEARIKSLQITEARLQEMIQNKSFMDKLSAVLEVERELTRVRSEIEQNQGQLRVMADRIALSTITLTLREPARIVPSASLSVEVPELNEAATTLGRTLESLGGQLISGEVSKRDRGMLMGTYQLQISLDRFRELLTAIETLGRVEKRKVNDQQFGDASAPWAKEVDCRTALVLYERSRELPSGVVQLEVNEVASALTKMDSIAVAAGASVTSNKTTRRDDGSSVAELRLRVPAGRFAELVDSLAPLGRTTAKQISGEAGRIVGGAAEVLCDLSLTLAERPRQVPSGQMAVQIDDFQAARSLLSEIVRTKGIQVLHSASTQRSDGTWIGEFRLGIRGEDMEAAVERLEKLGRIELRQISGLGLGDLSRMDPDALGVIGLRLAEKSTISPEPDRAAGSVRARLRDGLTGLYASVGLILYGLVVMAPWLIIVIVVAWLLGRAWRRRAGRLASTAKAPAKDNNTKK